VSERGTARAYWRSLEERADTPEFRAFVAQEFPGLADELTSPSRRAFLRLMAASLGVAGLTACRWPKELIVPFASRPEGRIPGVPQQFATAIELLGSGAGLLVTSVDGRPVKVEGNPLHPYSLGAATTWAQASLLELYDPDRSQGVVRCEAGQRIAAVWDDFAAFARRHFAALRSRHGAGLAFLTEATSSPSVWRLRRKLQAALPEARWFMWDLGDRTSARDAMRMVAGFPWRPSYHLERAEVVVAIDADPLFAHPAALRLARDFAATRRADSGTMSRLWVFESGVTITGAAADERVALPPSAFVRASARLLAELARLGATLPAEFAALVPAITALGADAPGADAIVAAARDLAAHRGRALVLVGERQDAAVQVLGHLANLALGSLGETWTLLGSEEPDDSVVPSVRLGELCGAMRGGQVETLLVLGGNPTYSAPPDLDFAGALAKVQTTIRLGLFDDETSRLCHWHLPQAHYLEAWGDVRAWDGTIAVQQPLIEPLFGGTSVLELLALVLGNGPAGGHELVRAAFRERAMPGEGEQAWRRALHDGVVAGSGWVPAPRDRRPEVARFARALDALAARRPEAGYELAFVPDASVYDGRFANNAWLQELPDPLTRLTWDNAALVSPSCASVLGVRPGDLVRIARGGRVIEIAAFVMPGQADNTVVLPLGYGRTAAGPVGNGVGFDTYALRTTDALRAVGGAVVTKTGRRYALATTQDHHVVDRVGLEERGRRIAELVREGTLAEYLADPTFVRERGEEPELFSLWQERAGAGEHQWGMAIELSACIGCNACVVACQAENNIPVVGKEQVARGREMHWLRIDRYFAGTPAAPRVVFQPVACQQCENAPCEQVCPVGATMHNEEGLNQQVYNRCVGTRYCSNNCPYKVRRFNFFNYFKQVPQVERMVFNPEVTIRSRGVMEKCTFCIQRIEAVKITAKNERRPVRDGDIVPACAQTCPTQAIVFGDLKDPDSRVARLHRHNRAYAVLGELNVRPRTRYLARLRNAVAGEGET
jgi:molybdopterin-containing oxidoreductase family iron-sulfur binding subunit